MFIDSALDSLGVMLTITTLDATYPFIDDFPEDVDTFEYLDIPNLTVRDLIQKCRLSTTNTSKEPS